MIEWAWENLGRDWDGIRNEDSLRRRGGVGGGGEGEGENRDDGGETEMSKKDNRRATNLIRPNRILIVSIREKLITALLWEKEQKKKSRFNDKFFF